MIKKLLLVFFSISFLNAFSQADIPSRMQFAGMELELSHEVRKEISTSVASLTKNAKYFQQKVDRANTYFPIIERIFEEEGLPDDFKYLVLQESSLTSDAVSVSNAVGFWQFKKESAQEVGLRVDGSVDERKNIVSATRGAARYIGKNFGLLNNWVYALQSYNTGYGGTKNTINSKYIGAKQMEIDKNTHWYVVKFLAHKIAFENFVGKTAPLIMLMEFNESDGRSLEEISELSGVDPLQVYEYNKWLDTKRIPTDKIYTVILPVDQNQYTAVISRVGSNIFVPKSKQQPAADNDFPKPTAAQLAGKEPILLKWNGLEAVYSRKGDDLQKLALQTDTRLKRFLRYNDLHRYDVVKEGQIYYLEKKREDGIVLFHIVKSGEQLWDIAQRYGIRLKSLKKKNRIVDGEALQIGRKLYLKMGRPEGEAVIIENPEKKPLLPANDPIPNKQVPVKIIPEDKKPVEQQPAKVQPIAVVPVETKPIIVVPSKPDAVDTDTFVYELHEVLQGQTLFAVARQYECKVDSIRKWNNMDVAASINIGQQLKIKKKVAASVSDNGVEDEFVFHEVAPGESMYAISRKYGVAIPEILKANGKADYSLATGEKLKIPKK